MNVFLFRLLLAAVITLVALALRSSAASVTLKPNSAGLSSLHEGSSERASVVVVDAED